MIIANQQLTDVTMDVCHSMLGLEIAEAMPQTPTETCEDSSMSASIKISGDSNILIVVNACPQAADAITTAMFGAQKTQEEEIADAVSEVANMIGGNIKGMLGGECNLSIPCFSNTTLELEDDAQQVVFSVAGGTMCVSYLADSPAESVNPS